MVRPPAEGDLIELDADEGASGHEQRGRRPALVVSVTAFQESGLAIVCPITTHGGRAVKPRSALEIALPAGLAASGVVLSHQVKTIDWKARRSKVLAAVPRATLLAVRSRLKTILGV